MSAELILDAVVASWAASALDERFNGVRLEELELGLNDHELLSGIKELVERRAIDCLSPPVLNPHIKRFDAPAVETQLKSLDVRERYHTVLYPTASTIRSRIDLSALSSKPFSRELAAGAPQLDSDFFEVMALDRYRRDPRYKVWSDGYTGHMSLTGDSYEAVLERDRVHLQTFGLGLDDAGMPLVCAFKRYTSKMSAEHQQYWSSFKALRAARMHRNYFTPSIMGDFYTDNGAIAAVRIAVGGINAASYSVWGQKVFAREVPAEVHFNVTPFMSPSTDEFYSFVSELWKIVGESLSKPALVAILRTEEKIVAGEDVGKLGTLSLFDRWLFSGTIRWGGYG